MFFEKKRVTTMILAGSLAVSLAACGGEGKEAGPNSNASKSAGSAASSAKSNYPEKPMSLFVPAGAGGGLDVMARTMAKVLPAAKLVEQTMTVENKPGGGQITGTTEFAMKDAGNNYKLMITSTPFVLNYVKKEGAATVSFRDVTPLARMQVDFEGIAVKADSKYKDLKSFVDDLKANPSKVTIVGGGAPGTLDYLNSILVADKSGVDITKIKYVAYDGGGEAMTALLGGNGDAMTSDLSSFAEYIKAGKVRVLGIGAPEKIKGEFSGIPTYKDQGLDLVVANWRGVFGPKNMADAAKKYWEEKLKALSDSKEWNDELAKIGLQNGYMNSADFIKSMEAEESSYSATLKKLGLGK
ncbi:tripartite tricarboxylate transporter substrate binding protein [Paenibacillus hamazuiensis]|uniref:tripartite tricarboxylate transporter substrate binding protein n=1 Tax=Paenibacillus hamazuiensis TaxID=2936508 RepID=UPI00200ED049|nr:tripartite tricarboxylate transporter substrate-binding protein [Paenibacillus hamazuiensis]